MDDVEVNLLRHIAGQHMPGIGQLCSRCGLVLDDGEPIGFPSEGIRAYVEWPMGEVVLVSVTGNLQCAESALHPDRDRSDEADCESIL